jgi:hypothetical protein
VVCDTAEEYSKRTQWVPAVEAPRLRELVVSGEPFRVAYVPDYYEDVEWLERLVASQEHISLLVDEIDVWYDRSVASLGEGLSWIAKGGRHHGQKVVAISRLASRMPIELRAEGSMWVFPIRHPGTRAEFQRAAGFDPIVLQVLERDPTFYPYGVVRTQVARIDQDNIDVYEFNTRTLKLYPSKILPRVDDEDEPELEPDPEPEPEPDPDPDPPPEDPPPDPE